MNYSTIAITFTENLPIGAQLGFDVNNSGGPFGTPTTSAYIYNWVNQRLTFNQVTTGPFTPVPGESTAINFAQAFSLDFGGQFVVTRVGTTVTIKAENIYSIREFYVNGIGATYVNHPSIQFVINNNVTAFGITNFSFAASEENVCEKVKISIGTSELAVKMISPVALNDNTDNPLEFEWLRGQYINVVVENADGQLANIFIDTPGILNLNADNFAIDINSSPNGSTVIAQLQPPDSVTAQFSLDGENWQNSNVFPGLAAGEYEIYVRDNFGCVKMKEFTVSEFGLTSPFLTISKSNSIRFAQRITFGDAANYKTDESTLSCEVDVKVPHKEIQRFQTSDVITTQIKSNYDTNAAKVIREDGTEIAVPMIQKTANIGLKDKRDARIYSLGGGKTGIYFTAGRVYDYVSDAVVELHTLNGNLPNWGLIGNYIVIDNAWYLIENTIFDESKNADVLVISSNYIGADSAVVVGSIYNLFNYEVYEFEIDMADFIDERIRVAITCEDVQFATARFLSEEIHVAVRHADCVEVIYWNNDNTDVFYATGIRHLIRIPLTKKEGVDEDESSNHKTDTTTILLNAQLYEVERFVFEPLTKELWRKLKQALTHKNVYLDGVRYIKNAEYETEGPLGDSNLYVLKALMIKTGNVYNSDGTAGGFVENSIEIPGLLTTESGFVQY